MTRGAITIIKWCAAGAAFAAISVAAAATPGEMFPVNICLTEGSDQVCVAHEDADGNGWLLVDIASIHPDLPDYPFPDGTEFRVTGQYCLDCVAVFCGQFRGFVFGATLVPCREGDVTGDGAVNVEDLVGVIANWGQCVDSPATCMGDADEDDTVGVGDLVMVIENWGS